MFSLQQIRDAHAKVKSGADFPKYFSDLIDLGVIANEIYVKTGTAKYYGENDYQITAEAAYPEQNIAKEYNKVEFEARLKAHQKGETDYAQFCKDAAETGVFKWRITMATKICTYFDTELNEVLSENIPV